MSTTTESKEELSNLAYYTHLRIWEQTQNLHIVNHPNLRTMDILEDLYKGDYGAIKTKFPSAKIYRTRIFNIAKESISVDLNGRRGE